MLLEWRGASANSKGFRMRQTSFHFFRDYITSCGGQAMAGKRKSQRPLSTKSPIHLILESDCSRVFHPGNKSLNNLIRTTAKTFHIHIYDVAINWSHIHFLIQIRERQDYVRFIRALTSLLTTAITKARPRIKKVFTLRPFTRLIKWGLNFFNVTNYLAINQMESLGWIKREKKQYKPTTQPKSKWKMIPKLVASQSAFEVQT